MIDMTAVKCVAAMGAALLAGCVILWLLDWFWGGRALRPLKEKPTRLKKQHRGIPQSQVVLPDDSRFRRPGGPLQPKPSTPIFGEGQPRHIRIDDTPHVIVPRQPIEPAQTVDSSDWRNLPVMKIDPVQVDEATPEVQKAETKSNKLNKSNRTMPMKRLE